MRDILGKNCDSWTPPSPTEIEILGNGHWEGVFLTSNPDDSHEKKFFEGRCSMRKKSSHRPQIRRRYQQGDKRAGFGPIKKGPAPPASISLRGTSYDTQL